MPKDLKPIWLYLAIYFGIQLIAGFIIGIIYMTNATEMVYKMSALISFIGYLVVAVIFLLIYHKQLKEKIKTLKKKDIIYLIVGSVILITVNVVISKILIDANIEMRNQEAIIEAYKNNKVLMMISVMLLAPFIEEMVFRYSLSTVIKNNTIFVIISSLIFGVMHGIGIVTILYIILGAILSLIYLKTNKNIVASTIAHILNNSYAILTMFIMPRI